MWLKSLSPFIHSFSKCLTWAWGGWQHNFSSTLFTHMCAKSLHLCLTLCNPMGRSLPGSSVHGILQARTLKNFLLQGIFPIQGLNLCLLCLLQWGAGSLPLAPSGKPKFSLHAFHTHFSGFGFLASVTWDSWLSLQSETCGCPKPAQRVEKSEEWDKGLFPTMGDPRERALYHHDTWHSICKRQSLLDLHPGHRIAVGS